MRYLTPNKGTEQSTLHNPSTTKPKVWTGFSVTAAVLTLSIGVASEARSENYIIQRDVQLSVSATEAWRTVGDFCDIDDWHLNFNACSLKVIDGKLHRELVTIDGSTQIDQLIAAEPGISYTYKTITSPLPITNYIATLAVEPLDGALLAWSARFSSDDPAMETKMTEMIEAGLAEVEKAMQQD